MVHDAVRTGSSTKQSLVGKLEVAVTVIVIVESLGALLLRITRVIDGFLSARRRIQVAYLLDPDACRRVVGGIDSRVRIDKRGKERD